MKRILTVAVAAIAAKVAFDYVKGRRAAPQPAGVPFEPAPRPTTGPQQQGHRAPSAPSTPDDLTLVNGIGPVYARRLADLGVRRFADLATANAAELADGLGTSPTTVESWQLQARELDS